MIIKVNGKQGDYFLLLGVQTNIGNSENEAIEKSISWSPKKAKSFNLVIQNTDYHGCRVKDETGYATCEVRYFTTEKEGLFKI